MLQECCFAEAKFGLSYLVLELEERRGRRDKKAGRIYCGTSPAVVANSLEVLLMGRFSFL